MISALENLKRIFWQEWDPIGVNDVPEAMNEYDGYAFEVWMKLKRGASVEDVEVYLDWAELEHMGSQRSRGRNREAAEKAFQIVRSG